MSSLHFSGTSVTDLCRGQGPWAFYIPPISPSKHHSVLYEFPINSSAPPVPYIPRETKHWDEDHVRMPYSKYNVYPIKNEDNSETLRQRWEIICETLKKPIKSMADLEKAINSYNSALPQFIVLEYLFSEVFSEEETYNFFESLLPKIISLALKLPKLLPGNLPLLKKNHNKSVSLSQLQVSCVLANAFLCTFPWRKEVAAFYPGVNFVRLYASCHRPKRTSCVIEKLKCIIHYFRRVTNEVPKGVITFERIFLPRNKLPRWDVIDNNLGNTRVHIQSSGTIEDDGIGFLQVDFANKNVGGGVLSYGCVQEEIRFVICPELLIGRLFIEQLGNTEAIIVRGVERFSKYQGYGDTFTWNGNYVDNTPVDSYGRKQTSITIIDANRFSKAEHQYNPSEILRELNKAYVGFYCYHTENLAPVATGNWGCGAFGGDTKLKTLIQLMACNATHRDLVYYTFGNKELEESFYNMYLFIATNKITTSNLWRILCRFAATKLPLEKFYSFIQQSWFDSKSGLKTSAVNSPLKTSKFSPKKKVHIEMSRDSSNINNAAKPSTSNDCKVSNGEDLEVETNLGLIDDVIPSSQPDLDATIFTEKATRKINFDEKFFDDNHKEILNIFSKIDAEHTNNANETQNDSKEPSKSTLREDMADCEQSYKIRENCNEDDSMIVDVSNEQIETSPVESRSKITHYFTKLSKR